MPIILATLADTFKGRFTWEVAKPGRGRRATVGAIAQSREESAGCGGRALRAVEDLRHLDAGRAGWRVRCHSILDDLHQQGLRRGNGDTDAR